MRSRASAFEIQGAVFLSLDDRLRLAAALEGFKVLPYSEEVHEADLGD